MELKTYQKKVIADLTRYLDLLNETKSDTAVSYTHLDVYKRQIFERA